MEQNLYDLLVKFHEVHAKRMAAETEAECHIASLHRSDMPFNRACDDALRCRAQVAKLDSDLDFLRNQIQDIRDRSAARYTIEAAEDLVRKRQEEAKTITETKTAINETYSAIKTLRAQLSRLGNLGDE
jgi:hypothetical protein